MSENKLSMHYVCTRKEAWDLVKSHKKFWVSNCGCRERKNGCAQSGMEVCLMFGDIQSSGSGKKEIGLAGVEKIFAEAKKSNLVARPFRNEAKTATDGICFCCNDCCEYFLNPAEVCDKGAFIEKTNMEVCTHCGACVDVCYFNARQMDGDTHKVYRENCYGCGLCVDVCPVGCITLGQVRL